MKNSCKSFIISLLLFLSCGCFAQPAASDFEYRGMHLDVSRHYFTPEVVKHYIDILAMHDINRFHWHLTDNQAWRLEIKAYPKLTEGIPFYSHDEVRDIVAYAATKGIEVIPEIDLPGHMEAGIKAYPELSCSTNGENLGNVLCIGNENTYTFISNVLKEVVDLFPSKMIHVGGDEVAIERWAKCPHCHDKQQSYCMGRIADILKSYDREWVMWDDVLDNGFDDLSGGYIMIWRDQDTAKRVHQLGGRSILSPSKYCYFDYFQTSNIDTEPRGFGNSLPVERVYSYNPLEGLTAEEAQSIVGVQANLWTEHVSQPEHVEYMLLPRLAALQEVQAGRNVNRSFHEFMPTLEKRLQEYKSLGLNYCRHLYDRFFTVKRNPEKRCADVFLTTSDGTIEEQKEVRSTCTIEALPHIADGDATEWTLEGRTYQYYSVNTRRFLFTKSTYCPIVLDDTYLDKPRYSFDGAVTLNDGICGEKNFATGDWLGFKGGPAVVTYDLLKRQKVSQVQVSCMTDMEAWISNIGEIAVEISNDGKTFKEVARQTYPYETDNSKKDIDQYLLTFSPVKARYVRVTVHPAPSFPETHDGYGYPTYLFIDEVSVE